MRKLKKKFLTVCALFAAVVTCTAVGVFSSVEGRHEAAVAQAESTTVKVLNDETWTGTATMLTNGGSRYTVTLTTTNAFNPTATWANDHDTINGVNVCDYLLFNGKTLTEWRETVKNDTLTYLDSTLDNMLAKNNDYAKWNPVAVRVDTNGFYMEINRNYLPAAGLEFGIKDGFEMQNNGTTYKTEGDLLFRSIPDVSQFETTTDGKIYNSVKVVPSDEAEITTKKATFSSKRVEPWDKAKYSCYWIVSDDALMGYGNGGVYLCNNNTYLNDYIMVNEHPLSYWNTVTYSAEYDYSSAPTGGSSRTYGTSTYAQMYQSDNSTTIAVFLHTDWMADQGITNPEFGIKDGMLYVGRDGATIYEQGTPTEVMNDNWTATATLTATGGSQYSVTLKYSSAFNPTAAWINNASENYNSHVCALGDYLVFNGKTMAEWREIVKNDDFTYLSTALDNKLNNGAAWNPVAVCVNTDNITIQINRNYLAPGGLEFGIKAGFEMTNNGTVYKTTEDVMFKLIPDISSYDSSRSTYDGLKAVLAENAGISTSRATATYSRTESWDSKHSGYSCYQIVSTALMGYGNYGTYNGDHNLYLNDYITVNGKPLSYWNTVMYSADYTYTGAPGGGNNRAYAVPMFAQMYQSDTSTTIAVYLNNDWLTAQNIANPEFGIKDGMVYVGRGGATICEYRNAQNYEMSFVAGASVRASVDDNTQTGIRFTANVDTALATEATEVGMFIVPESYITAYKTSGYSDYFNYFAEVKGKTKASISTTFDKEQIESGTLKGCIVGIKDENWTRSYQAVTYYIADGEYYYSEPSDARSITYVADKALTDATADYSSGLKTALANIIGKSLTPTTAEISGKYEETFDISEKFNFNVDGNISWSVVSGTAVTLSGTTATIVDSGTVTLRFSAYGGQLTKDVTLTVNCQMTTFSFENYGGGNVATAPAFSIKETTDFTTGAFYINDTTNTTNGKMILNGEEKVVFQDGSYNATNGLYQFANLVSGITLSVGDVITLKKGTTFSQGDSVYYLSETTCLKYYNASNWVVYTVNGEITLNAYTGNASMAASEPAFSINGETEFTEGWFYIDNTVQNTNGNMLLNGEEKVVFKAGYYWTNTNSYQFKTLADGITLSVGDVVTLKKGTTFSQKVGAIVYVLSKNVDLTYTGASWTVENYDGKISVSGYYGGIAASAPAFCLNETTKFTKGAFCINDTTNTTNGKMILNGEEKVVFNSGDYNPDNGAYQFTNLASGITLSVGDVITLKKGTTFSQGNLVYIFSADVYLTYSDETHWVAGDDIQSLSLNGMDTYAFSNTLVGGTDLALEGSATVASVRGRTLVNDSSVTLTATYYPSPIGKIALTCADLTGTVTVPAGTVFVINNTSYVLEKSFSCDVETVTIEDTSAKYYTFADFPPRGSEANLEQYFDLGFTTYLLTTDGFPTYITAAENVASQGKTTMVRNMGTDVATTNTWFTDNERWTTTDGNAFTTSGNEEALTKSLSALYAENKISDFYMADEYYSSEFDSLGDLIAWKNTYANDKLWHMNLVGSLSYDHWDSGYSGTSWWESIVGVDHDKYQKTYGTHVDDYINKIVKNLTGGTASVCLDCYPFREIGAGEIYDYYLFDLLTAANKTKAYNDSRSSGSAEARFGICLQTYTFIQPNKNSSGEHDLGRDISSAAEVSMQIYTGLAMGADLFEYFSYCTAASSGSTANGIVSQDGWYKQELTSRGDMYNYVQTANGNALPFAKITSTYDWQGTFYTAGSMTSENGTAFGRIGDLVTSNKGAMTNCSSTYDALYGRYTKDGQDGFMVVNYTDPTKNHTNDVTMNFSGYNYAIVYTTGGTATVMPLSNGALTLSLATGAGAFVVPMV